MTTVFLVTAPILGQMHIPKLLSKLLAFCVSHYFLGLLEVKIKGRLVSKPNTENYKCKVCGVWRHRSRENLGTRPEEKSLFEKETKTKHKKMVVDMENLP